MDTLDKLFATAKSRQARVVFPEMDEERVAAAVEELASKGLCRPLALGAPSSAQLDALINARGMKEALAKRLLSKPLYQAAAMVAAGEADVMVAGADVPTRRVIEAASMAIGPARGISVPSSFFLMIFPDGREMVFADCAVNVSPSAAELADIARATVASAQKLFGHAEAALLSYSTGTSGAGAGVDLVRKAAESAGLTGPLQADAALNSVIAAKKGVKGGNANVLIFPDLNAGNIAYKLCQELAGAQALGPFLQGFAKPVCDLSRGAGIDDIVRSTVVTIALS